MKIAVTGHNGNVGKRLIAYGYDKLVCDVRVEREVERAITSQKPDIIIHLAAKSDIDFCEKLENQEIVSQTHLRGSANVFKWANKVGAKVISVSTDHVFSGNGFGKYTETSKPNPKNYYGLTKLASDALAKAYDNVNIVRTSTLFWDSRPLVEDLIECIAKGNTAHVPSFMWRSYLHIDHFVTQLVYYCNNIEKMPKILNLSGNETASWYKFAVACAKAYSLDDSKVKPKYFEKSDRLIVPRPHRAGLSNKLAKSLGIPQYSYRDGFQ